MIEKLERGDEIQSQFNKLIFQRNALITEEYPYLVEQLQSISEQLDSDFSYQRELAEAITIASEVENVIFNMVRILEDAKSKNNWGDNWKEIKQINYDRNSTIDKAVDLSYRAKQLLQELKEQLEDIYKFKAIKRVSKFEEFQHFNDIYYDLLISDWIVKRKISNSINFLIGTNDSVERVLSLIHI